MAVLGRPADQTSREYLSLELSPECLLVQPALSVGHAGLHRPLRRISNRMLNVDLEEGLDPCGPTAVGMT